MEALGLSQSALGREVGVSQQTIHKLIVGQSRSSGRIGKIARVLQTTPDYLEGETDDPHANAPLPAPPREDVVQVAMLDLAYGMGETFLEHSPEVRHEEFPLAFIRHFTKSRVTDLMIAEGVGDSMAPTIGPNDLVLIDRAAINLNIDDRIWACAIGEMGMIKRLRASGEGITILSDNPLVPDNHAADGELHIIGRVVGTFGRL
uniref:Putative DNA binding, helix-turn-helix domain containing protein n=1 Tax=viral metagenome TaxID=1070528 RepID=A0A6M3XIM5_9ZZZZ